MSRYIDADLLFKSINKLVPCDYGSMDSYEAHEAARDVMCDVLDLLDETPTANVQEVKHGRWIGGYCSRCSKHAPYWSMASTYYESMYCPNCGAIMDGGEQE